MANETLLLRKGLLANLESAPKIEGALSFTIDEPAIYIDVKNDNGVVEHLRIGDIKEYDSLDKLKEFLGTTPVEKVPTTGLYYAIKENALMKCAIKEEKDGTRTRYWQQINVNYSGDISALQAQITAINTAMGGKPDGWSDASIWAAIAKNRSDIAAEVQRATDVEGELRDDIDGVRVDLGNKTDAADANGSAFARIAAEKARAEVAEAGLQTAINAEKTRAEGVESGLRADLGTKSDVADANGSAFARIAKNAADIVAANGEIAKKANSADVYTTTEVDGFIQGLNTSITNLSSNKADKSSVYTMTEVDGFVQGAKDHSDANLATAKSYADGKLVEAKAYTDEKVGVVNNTFTGFQTSVNESLSSINGEITNLKTADTNTGLRIDGVVSRVEAVETGKADSADTLAGYGITNAYTKAETETAIDNKIAAVNATNAGLNNRLVAVEGTLAGIGEGETVVGLIKATASAASAAAATAETNAKSHADAEIAKEKKRAEDAETALTQSIGTLRTLVGVVPEGSDNVIDYINDSQTAQSEAITSAYEAYVDEKLRVADGMSYKGIVNFDDKVLPTSGVQAGDTYKVAKNGKVGNEDVYVGDLIIANSDQSGEDAYADWDIVHSGYEDDHDVHIELNDGVIEIISAAAGHQSRGGIKIEGNYVAPGDDGKTNGGVRITLTESDPDAGIIDVTAKVEMVWGSF